MLPKILTYFDICVKKGPIDYFDRGAVSAPERIFAAGGDVSFTYEEASEQTIAIAKALYGSGFQVGDSVGVYSPNDPGAVVCIFAAYRAGE